MSRKIYNAGKLQVRYEKAASKGAAGKQEREELLAQADRDIEAEGAFVEINRDANELIDVSILPSLHSMMENMYTIIDAETRRLMRQTVSGGGMDKVDSQHFGQLTRSICQLANLEHGIREQNQLEQMSDDELKRLADIAYKKLKGKSK
jgi:uncharacterized protein YjiS (DUF1127 family)|tara:strand:+ start:378 stop:824 length:447 start_codon:yes stop_codon:yes gene_type:complete